MHPSLKLAVALKYEHHEDVAPLVVAAGRNKVAQALEDRARALGIPVHADEPLAQSLSVVPVGSFVPEELYPVVAQVLAMVYAMDKQLEKAANEPPPARDSAAADESARG